MPKERALQAVPHFLEVYAQHVMVTFTIEPFEEFARTTIEVGQKQIWNKDYRDLEAACAQAVELGGMTLSEQDFIVRGQPMYRKGFRNEKEEIDVTALPQLGFRRL